MQGRESRTGDDVAFVVLVSMVMISGLADGLCGGSLVGATGELPGRYMQAVFAGNATAGYLSENVESARFTDCNGYLTSVLMILAPKLVPIEEAEVVGIAMETFLVVGLVVGSAFGWLWNI
ncbi:equilibrative nucleotide transporter 8-like protein [Tanacetum coccineum]